MMIQRFGWRRDLPDQRDFLYRAEKVVEIPPLVDLRPKMPPILDQGNLGSCTANAIADAHRYAQMMQEGGQDFAPSRLFIYYNERVLEWTVPWDSGATIRDGIKTISKQGVCPEEQWPYNIAKFTRRPPKKCYTHALKHQAISYYRVFQSIDQMKACLAAGFPIVFGFSVYESFDTQEVAETGIMPMPGPDESLLSGHAVLMAGYDDEKRTLIVKNSWGEWGDKGYFYMPYDYASNYDLAADFWTIRLVEEDK